MAPFGAALALAPLAAGGLLLAVQLVRLRRRRAPLLGPGLAGTTLLAFVVALVPTHALALPVDVNGLPIPNGDLNADGRLDAADALLEQQIATGRRVASAEQLDRGDIAPVNLAPKAPHAIAAGDVALLLRAIRGVDVDQDLLGTDEEMAAGSSPFRIDSDRDGLGDFEEIRVLGSSPGNADTDGDGVLDAAEVNTQGTDPTDADTDGDGFADGAEIAAGTSPLAGVVYRHGDHLGSTALVTRSDGAVLQRVVYKPYGGLSVAQGADATPRLGFYFTGQRLESSVGLYDYGARFYDPALGRFLQPDSIVPSPLDPQALNRYAYVRNNPLRYVDPTGHFWAEMWGGVTSAGSWIGSQVGSLFSESGGGVSANPLRWPGQIVGAIGNGLRGSGNLLAGVFGQAISSIGAVLEAPGMFLQDAGAFALNSTGVAGNLPYTGIAQTSIDVFRTDVAAMAYGTMATATGILGGLGTIPAGIGIGLATGDFLPLRDSLLEVPQALAMPRYAGWGGLGHPGINALDKDVSYFPTLDTRVDQASRWHDGVRNIATSSGAQFEWIRQAWTGAGAEPGLYGQAYRVLGTIGFAAVGGAQYLLGLNEDPIRP